MKNIKILGSGCTTCKSTFARIEKAAREMGVNVKLEKVEDMQQIMSYGILSTPGVVIDGQVVHAGGIPDKKTIESWLGS